MKNVEHKWTVQDIPSQAGRLALVTGATSGVGFYAAKELAKKSATVIMPARDMRKAKEAAERIEAEVPKAQLYLAVGRRLWDESERVTDMQFVISAPSIGIHDRHYLG